MFWPFKEGVTAPGSDETVVPLSDQICMRETGRVGLGDYPLFPVDRSNYQMYTNPERKNILKRILQALVKWLRYYNEDKMYFPDAN